MTPAAMTTPATPAAVATPDSRPAEGAPPGRLAWADVAKGVCILLVVLHHTTTKHYEGLVGADLSVVSDAWVWLTGALKPIRMPLFFVISGFFAARAVHRPWGDVLRPRVLNPYYVYTVWLGVLAVVFSVERSLPMNRTQDARELVLDLLFASTGLWFLYAMALYFALTKLTLRYDVRWVLGVAALVAATASLWPIDEANRVSVLHHAVYFALGARLPDLVRQVAAASPRLVPALAAGYAAAAALVAWLGLPQSVVNVSLSLLGVPLALLLSVQAARSAGFTRVATSVGRRSLPVYVMHMPLLAVLHHVPGLTLATGVPVLSLALAVTYPALAAAAITALALGLHTLLLRLGGQALFALPGSWRLPERTRHRLLRRARGVVATVQAHTTLSPRAPLHTDQPSRRMAAPLSFR